MYNILIGFLVYLVVLMFFFTLVAWWEFTARIARKTNIGSLGFALGVGVPFALVVSVLTMLAKS